MHAELLVRDAFMRKGVLSKVFIMKSGTEADFERLVKIAEQSKPGSSFILKGDITIQDLGHPFRELQVLDILNEYRQKIVTVTGVPEIMLGITKAATLETSRNQINASTMKVKSIQQSMSATVTEALKILNIEKAPCIVYECSRRKAIEAAAIVHTNREELTSAEKGKFIMRCINEGVWKNVEEAARNLGFSKDTLYDWIREAKMHTAGVKTRLKSFLNRDTKRALAAMPRPVRERIINELDSLTEDIIEKIKNHLPNILEEISRESYELDTEEVIVRFKVKIAKFLESGLENLVRFRGLSGSTYQIEKVESNIVIRVFSRESSIHQLMIPFKT